MEIARVKMLIGEGRRRGVGLSDRQALPKHNPQGGAGGPSAPGCGTRGSPGAAPGPGGRSSCDVRHPTPRSPPEPAPDPGRSRARQYR